MSAIAQRRVAGATALMILLYLLQVALFAPPAQAAVSFILNDDGPGSTCPSNMQTLGSTVNEDWGTASDSGGSVSVTLNPGYVVDICTKQGAGHQIWRVTYAPGAQTVSFDPSLAAGNAGAGLSHWGWALVEEPTTPQTPPITVGACDDEGLRPVSFSVPAGYEISINDSDNVLVGFWIGPQDVSIDLPPGDYDWTFWEFINDEDKRAIDQGSFTVDPCDDDTTTTTSTTTTSTTTTSSTMPPPPTPPGTIIIVKETDAPTTDVFDFTLNGFPFSLGSGEQTTFPGQGPGLYTVTELEPVDSGFQSVSCDDSSTTVNGASATFELNSGETVTCVFVNDVAEVAGTTITTVPEVSADTLPFTGFETGDTLKLGLLALLAGGLMLFAVSGRKEDEAATITEMGGWSSL